MLLKSFRWTAYFEGISYILLLFFAVPMKYLQGDPSYVKMLGMPHGIFFILYVLLAVYLSSEENWSGKKLTAALMASLLPFGTFVFDYKHFHQK